MYNLIDKKTILLLSASLLALSQPSSAQQKRLITKEKQESLTVKPTTADKTVIEIDGDKVFVNGSPITTQGIKSAETYNSLPVLQPAEVLSLVGQPAPPLIPAAPATPLAPIAPDFVPSLISVMAEPRALLGVYSEKDEKGAKITNVVAGSPAQKAGLEKGDIIIKVGDKSIDGPAALAETISAFKPREEVQVTYLREKKKKTVKITLGEQENNFSYNFQYQYPNWGQDMGKTFKFDHSFDWSARPRLGIRIQELEEGKGVKVLEVQEASAAERSGLKKDDIITSIDGQKIENADQAKEKINQVKDKSSYLVSVSRDGSNVDVEIKTPKKLKTTDL